MIIYEDILTDSVENIFEGVELETLPIQKHISKFDLTFMFSQSKTGISVGLEYNTDLFESRSIERFLVHFKQLVETICSTEDVRLMDINLNSEQDIDKLQTFSLSTFKPIDIAQTFVQLFEEKVKEVGQMTAINSSEGEFSYEALNQMVNALAHLFVDIHNIQAGDRIALIADKSAWSAIGILAAMKARATFVPIDSANPSERIKYILEDANAKLVMGSREARLVGLEDTLLPYINLADIQGQLQEYAGESPGYPAHLKDAAYICYTSGSTGRPKGVAITHESLSNYLLWANSYYFNNTTGYHFPLFTSLAFDLTLTSLFTTLLRGDSISIYPDSDLNQTLHDIFSVDSSITAVKADTFTCGAVKKPDIVNDKCRMCNTGWGSC